jgi:hypothetical protein
MAKTNYNGTASAGASAQVAPAVGSRITFFFQAVGADMVLNFGATATADDVLLVKSDTSVSLTNRSPYPINKQINVFCASAAKFQCQSEES